jgi:hypothetical protein
MTNDNNYGTYEELVDSVKRLGIVGNQLVDKVAQKVTFRVQNFGL